MTREEIYGENSLERDILFTSMCEHHLLPFRGVAHTPYIGNGRVTGLSKLARVVEDVSRRSQVQQRMTQTVADCLKLVRAVVLSTSSSRPNTCVRQSAGSARPGV